MAVGKVWKVFFLKKEGKEGEGKNVWVVHPQGLEIKPRMFRLLGKGE